MRLATFFFFLLYLKYMTFCMPVLPLSLKHFFSFCLPCTQSRAFLERSYSQTWGAQLRCVQSGRPSSDTTVQNCRRAWLGRDLRDHLVPAPLMWAGCSSPDQIAHGPIQPGLDHLRGGACTAFLGSLFQHLATFSEKLSPDISSKSPLS